MDLWRLAILSALALVALKYLITLIQRARSPLAALPGPWYSKWTSLELQYYFMRGQRAMYVERLHQKYGKVVRVSPDEVDFSSLTASKRIHSYNRPFLKSIMYTKFGDADGVPHLFNAVDPEYHARHRRLLSGPMSEANLKGVEYIVQERLDLAIERIGDEMKREGCADVMKWWLFFSTDVIGELTFGDSFRMLEQGKKNQYVDDLEMVAKFSGLQIQFPTLIKIGSYFPIRALREPAVASQRLSNYASESIRRYEKIVAADPWNPKPTLFTKLFKAGEEGMAQKEVVASGQAYIVGGSDTTTHTMTYLTWRVCRDEQVKRRLVEELAALPEGYRDADLKNLPYLNEVISEVLRLYSAAPSFLPREVPPGGCEVDGFWMPGGTTVGTQAYSMHRDPVIFPEPEKFNPSRWESPTKDMKDAWMPFGGGARICIGLHLAQMELRLATAKFFRTFPNARVSDKDGFSDDDMEQVIYFLMFPKKKYCPIQAS
ncbi:cytochrome protein [Massariosphaeria phaeospora]|uniref:Cytochrome protein n=1 Tax=Massariosphaeria phaeospora TaxID=100035 RepID=A0A7C8MDI0_9PLEO|nr:cytochrome protein [Massariosphaeria phaeospora]